MLVNGDFTFTPSNIWMMPPEGIINGVTYYELNGITSFSGGTGGFSINDDASLLPVTWISIVAEAIENTFIRISWSTATEIENLGFALERSRDGVSWDSIAFIAGHGTSSRVHEYSYDDHEVASGTYYYRLRQIDYDGTYEYSAIVSATLQRSIVTDHAWARNPISDLLTIFFDIPHIEKEITLYDMQGKRMQTYTSNDIQVSLPTAHLASGVYIVHIRNRATNTWYEPLRILKI